MEFADDQASSRIELDNGTVITKCDNCRAMWRERNERGIEGDPPCDKCQVELLEENSDAIQIFFLIRYQLIMGPESPIDINHLAIHAAINLYGIRNRRECFEKVLTLCRWWLKKIKAEEE